MVSSSKNCDVCKFYTAKNVMKKCILQPKILVTKVINNNLLILHYCMSYKNHKIKAAINSLPCTGTQTFTDFNLTDFASGLRLALIQETRSN